MKTDAKIRAFNGMAILFYLFFHVKTPKSNLSLVFEGKKFKMRILTGLNLRGNDVFFEMSFKNANFAAVKGAQT